MQRRPDVSADGGLWEFPGGKLEPGEAPEVAGVRELEEELGVRIAPGDLRPVSFASSATTATDLKMPLIILLYACHSWSGLPHPHAASELRWCEADALSGLAMPPLDYPLAAALNAFLKSK